MVDEPLFIVYSLLEKQQVSQATAQIDIAMIILLLKPVGTMLVSQTPYMYSLTKTQRILTKGIQIKVIATRLLINECIP